MHVWETFPKAHAFHSDLIWAPSAHPEYLNHNEWLITPSTALSENPSLPGEIGLMLTKNSSHHAISADFKSPLELKHDHDLILQYEVRFHRPLSCGGSFIPISL